MRNAKLMVGAFYNPHLGRELAVATGIDHLAMADPPAASDAWWPAIGGRYTLLLHDYLGSSPSRSTSAPSSVPARSPTCTGHPGSRSISSVSTPRTAGTT